MSVLSAAPTAAPRRAWLIWGVGAGVYVLAVFHRTSLGVAGPMAADRLHLNAGQLSSFVMLQLGLYGLMQVPTGILVDRFGPRRMLLAATITIGLSQLLFSVVTSYPLGLLARGLLGTGDAMCYISVLRLAAGWFPPRQYPIVTAYTGLLGTAGNLVATIPLTGLLRTFGWTPTFAVAGAMSLAYVGLLLRKATAAPFQEAAEVAADSPVAGNRVLDEVKAAWRMPGGRLGFWVHLTTMAAPVVFTTLWGFPYLREAIGLAAPVASSLMLLMVLVGLVSSLTIGRSVARHPSRRTPLAVIVAASCLVGWLVLIGWPGGHPPLAAVIVVLMVLAVGGPASSVAFMLARDYNPRHRISTATGMVNIGGFCGAVIGVFTVGLVLDGIDGPVQAHSAVAYRWAFATLALLTAFGLWRMMTWWLRTRAVVLLAAARGEAVPVQIQPHRWELVDRALLEQESRLAREAREAREAELARVEADAIVAAGQEPVTGAQPTVTQQPAEPGAPPAAAPAAQWPPADETPTGPIPVVRP